MRDYLKLWEVENILSQYLDQIDYESAMISVNREANTCLCHAYNHSECMCGAWEVED